MANHTGINKSQNINRQLIVQVRKWPSNSAVFSFQTAVILAKIYIYIFCIIILKEELQKQIAL